MLLGCVLALVASACSGDEPQGAASGTATTEATAVPEPTALPEPTAASDPTTVPEPTQAPESQGSAESFTGVADTISWEKRGLLEFGTLAVPLDHDDPSGPMIDIAISRLVTQSKNRLGTLFLNFGGPSGESGEIFVRAASFFGDIFGDSFDIMVWDPRGIGDTERLACDGAGVDNIFIDIIDPTDGFDSELAAETADFEKLAECAAATGPIVDHLSTVDVAKDLDLLRQAVGDDALNFLGYSYGTQIGWVYATLFPDNVRAMVLDGAVPPGSFSGAGLIDQYIGFERTFDEFADWCEANTACLAHEEGLRERVERVTTELRAAPITLGDGTTMFDADDFLGAVTLSLYSPVAQAVRGLDFGIDEVDRGSARLLASEIRINAESSTPGTYKGVLCADGYDIDSEADSIEQMTNIRNAAPLFGRVNEGIRCDLWPGEIVGLPELDTTGAPLILVVGNTLDPATPYESAIELDGLLDESVLLTYEGAGHTVVGSDRCIDEFAIDYLVNLVGPPIGTVC